MIALVAVLDYANATVWGFYSAAEIDAWYHGGGGMSQALSDKFWAWMLHTSHWTETGAYTSASADYNEERARE